MVMFDIGEKYIGKRIKGRPKEELRKEIDEINNYIADLSSEANRIFHLMIEYKDLLDQETEKLIRENEHLNTLRKQIEKYDEDLRNINKTVERLERRIDRIETQVYGD